jgi:hypothetical protein
MLTFLGLSMSASAQTTIASGDCGAYGGNNLTWTLTETGGDTALTISGTGAMKDVMS